MIENKSKFHSELCKYIQNSQYQKDIFIINTTANNSIIYIFIFRLKFYLYKILI